MSGPEQEISPAGGDGVGDDEEDGDGVVSPSRKDAQKTEKEKKPKRVSSVFRFGKKAKKTLLQLQSRCRRKRRRKKKKGGSVNSGCFGRWGDDGVVSCCLCGKQPPALDSSGESTQPQTSDPNSKEFTYDMMKVFIENNDFYAAECNPHLDCDD